MKIRDKASRPPPRGPRTRWAELWERVRGANGEWVEIDFSDEDDPRTEAIKCRMAACNSKALVVETRLDLARGITWIRLKKEES